MQFDQHDLAFCIWIAAVVAVKFLITTLPSVPFWMGSRPKIKRSDQKIENCFMKSIGSIDDLLKKDNVSVCAWWKMMFDRKKAVVLESSFEPLTKTCSENFKSSVKQSYVLLIHLLMTVRLFVV